MKFLMYSTSGEGAQILHKIKEEGNEVCLYIKDKIYSSVFDGLLDKTDKPDDFIDANTVIIFDISGNGPVADKFRRSGHFVYGSSCFADDLEHDRKFGFDFMRKSGILTPDSKEFKNFSDGISYAQECEKRLVFKPSGSMPCKLTYVSKDTDELIRYLKFVEKHFSKDIESFVLQDFVEGYVVSSEIFLNGSKVLTELSNHTVEVKKSMNEDLGAATGCSGNITWPCSQSEIIKNGIQKASDLLIKEQFVGQIDLNAVVDKTGQVFGLEWTPRFGYDATPTFLTLLNIDYGEFFSNITRGNGKESDLMQGYAGSIRVSIPPYPAEFKEHIDPDKFSPSLGVPILGWENHQKNIYFYEVMVDDEELVHSGGAGVIGITLGISDNYEDCLDQPYEIAKKLNIPDKQYRTDLVEVLGKMTNEVEEYT